MGSGLLAEDDGQNLAKFLNITEKELKEKWLEEVELFNNTLVRPKVQRKGKPYGQCVFYKDKKCSVHEAKPLQCKVSMGCRNYSEDLNAWFLLNHIINKHDPEAIRQYASYIKNGGHVIPGGQLEELVPDKEMLSKILSYEVLK
jgi:hypothetical protein